MMELTSEMDVKDESESMSRSYLCLIAPVIDGDGMSSLKP